ncbi:MAG: transcriptional repressor [Deltaproteobacteria bacterium]|nr:transcriptional repressor [Deltaproteobacteria bacterium]
MIGKYRDSGLKLTPQRIAILDYLEGNIEHPSADDIYKAMSKRFPTMSFATVYNTLETLRRHGQITELNFDPFKKRFDPNPSPHHHVICVRCQKILDVKNAFLLKPPRIESEEFEIIGNHIEFYGICSKCKPR